MSISPHRLPGQDLRCDGTLDIECAEWDRFVVGCTHDGSTTRLHRTADGLAAYLVARGGTWWAHAGGVYDLLAIANVFRKSGLRCQISLSRSRVSSLTCGKLVLRDSYGILPMPLDEVAAITGDKLDPLPWACECGRECGGYCRISAQIANGAGSDPDLDDYVIRDAKALWTGLHAIAQHATDHDIKLSGTVGSTAWKTAKSLLQIPDSNLDPRTWASVAEAYHGGRVFVGRAESVGAGSHWDISGAYPASLARTPLPLGLPTCLDGHRALSAYVAGVAGVYTCLVRVPETLLIPPLPTVVCERLIYPTGEFSDTWTLIELQAAEARGVEIVDVYRAVCWQESAILFDELVAHWFAIRKTVGKKTPLGAWQRELSNSLPGKFAERPDKRVVVMHPKDIKVCMREGKCRDGCHGLCGAHEQVDMWGEIWSVPLWRPSTSAHIQWAAYVLSATRIQWLEGAEKIGENLVYGDTDSLWCLGNKTPGRTGSALGNWEYKHAWKRFECNGPKCYAWQDSEGVHPRVAGANRLTVAEWRRGSAERERGVSTFLEAARSPGGLFKRRRERWRMPRPDVTRDRVWLGDRVVGSGNRTYPANIREHQERGLR